MVNVSDLAGTLILLIVFIAVYPLLETALGLLLPQLGPTESFIASSIPVVLLLLILTDPFTGSIETRR